MHLKEIKNIYHKELDEIYPKEEVDSFFYLLIEHFLRLERFVLVLQPGLVISKEEEQPLFESLAQLKLHRPVQHIIGKTQFMDMDFEVDENVLIPRPETEELVRWILQEASNIENGNNITENGPNRNDQIKILDIGTGSGCIAIALAKNLPKAHVYAMDVSKNALTVARRNAKRNKTEIEFMQADILQLESLEVNFDLMVSNPPYIRDLEKEHIPKNVKDYEPQEALFVPDENPLIFYKAIIDFASKSLKKGGSLFLEINQYLPSETQLLLEQQNFTDIELRKDMFGNNRLLKGKVSC